MADPRTIVALGGYSTRHLDPRDVAFERWLVDRARGVRGRERPRIAYVGTAGGDAEAYASAFEAEVAAAGAEPLVLRLFHREVRDLHAFALDCDAILVGGGNTVSLLAVWRAHGLPPALRAAWEAGVVLAGVSAGMLCWFEGGTTDSFDLRELAPLRDGLGLLPGSACPHYDGEAQRRPLYERLVREGELPPGIAVDDGAGAVFTGTELTEVIAWRGSTASAYRVTAAGSSEPFPVTRIGG